jgi:hypothetical protein
MFNLTKGFFNRVQRLFDEKGADDDETLQFDGPLPMLVIKELVSLPPVDSDQNDNVEDDNRRQYFLLLLSDGNDHMMGLYQTAAESLVYSPTPPPNSAEQHVDNSGINAGDVLGGAMLTCLKMSLPSMCHRIGAISCLSTRSNVSFPTSQ